MRLQAGIFDMDGTLIDSMSAWRRQLFALVEELGGVPEPCVWTDTRAMTVGDTASYLKERYVFPQSPQAIEDRLGERMRHYYTQEAEPKPGLVRFLTLMKMEGVGMYVSTATPRALTEAGLQCAGLDGFFRGIVTCQEAGQTKEEGPAVFEHALRRLRVRKEAAVVFEDSLPALKTAKAAGFRIAGVYDATAEDRQPEIQRISDYYIRSWEEMSEKTDL